MSEKLDLDDLLLAIRIGKADAVFVHDTVVAMWKRIESLESRASNAGGAVAAGHFVRRSKFGPWIEIDPAKEKGGTPLYTHPAPASKEPVADERAAFEAAYVEHMNTQEIHSYIGARDYTGEEIATLREGQNYGFDRSYLNGCWAGWKMARAALATAQPVPEPKSSNPNAGGTQEYLATEHYNEGWNDCRNAMLAAAPAKPEGV